MPETAPAVPNHDTAPTAADAPSDSSAPDLSRLKKMFDDSRTTTEEPRRQANLDRDYYDGNQYTAEQRKKLASRGQPDIVINRVRRGVDGILGVVEQGRTDPRAFMRNPPDSSDQGAPNQGGPAGGGPPMAGGMAPGAQQPKPQAPLDAGDVATMTLRYIADVNRFQASKMEVLENMLVEGDGAVIIEVDQANDNEVNVNQIRWEEFFYDPRSRRPDFLDARYLGIGKWMYADMLAATYPEMAEVITGYADGSSTLGAFDSSWEDRPGTANAWVDTKQKRLMVVEMYYIEAGQWMRCVFYCGDILETAPSPYKNDKDQAICPIVAQSAYVDRENRRYGVVRDMRGPQDEINNRRSRALFEINTRQIQQKDPNAPPIDVELAQLQAAMPGGVLPPGWEIVPRQDMVANNILLLQEAKSEIERMGPNPAILGRQGADASGRAQQIRQQAGLTEYARLFGRFRDWEERCYKLMWGVARQFWNDPKWVRVTDDMGAPQYVRINDPVVQPVPQLDPTTGQMVMAPQVTDVKNHIAKMDVDIVVDSVPDTATLQQEIFGEIMQLAQAYGPQNVPFKVILELSPLPKRREIIKQLETAMAEQAAAMMQNPMAQLQTGAAKADIAKTMSEVDKNRAQAKATDIKATTDAMHAHASAQGYAAGHHMTPPPGEDAGAMNGSGAP